MSEASNEAQSGPYATAAVTYWNAGWRGVLPLPPNRKLPPPTGFTGPGADPSRADLQAWVDDREGRGNIALRLPVDIIGVDVDAYDGKRGAATLAAMEDELGALPATWRTTSRDDGVSGIRLYRAPAGKSWADIGEHIEVIHHGWRYALVWPSRHPEGRTYRWVSPQGITSTEVPDPDDLPLLPAPWVERLCRGDAEAKERNNLHTPEAAVWLTSLPGAGGEPCRRLAEAVDADSRSLAAGNGSAHDMACAAVARVVRLAAEGHTGATSGLEQIHVAFMANVTNARRVGTVRSRLEAQAEWIDLLRSAINLVSASAPTVPSCDCNGDLTALIVGDDRRPAPATVDGDDDAEEGEPLAEQPTRTTWWPRDLGPVLTGEQVEEPPTVLVRDDGQPLWYRGKVNGLIGESESGKTWVALEAVRQLVTRGRPVLYLDFEDAAPGIVSRLRSLGVDDRHIRSHLVYVDPAEALTMDAKLDLTETLQTREFDLIVVDGFNAAMTLLGLDLMSNTDATKFAQQLLKPLAKTGAAVAYIDHVPKNGKDETSGGIGAQAKRAMTTGCALRVKVMEPFGKGMTGELIMTVDKDRAGHVRGASSGGKNAGTVTLASDPESGAVEVTIATPDMTTPQQRNAGKQWTRWEDICTALQGAGGPMSTGALHSVVGGRKDTLVQDLGALKRSGHVYDKGHERNHKWVLVEAFTVAEALTRSVVPTRSHVVPGTGGEEAGSTRSPVPVSITGTGTGRPSGGSDAPETRIVERVIAGARERVDMATGEVVE